MATGMQWSALIVCSYFRLLDTDSTISNRKKSKHFYELLEKYLVVYVFAILCFPVDISIVFNVNNQ